MEYLISVDVGTTSCKVAIFNLTGDLIAEAQKNYSLYIPRKNFVEQNAEEWWIAVCKCIKSVLKLSKVSAENVISICSTGQFPSLVLIGKHGKPLRQAIIYSDMRGEEQSGLIFNKIGLEKIKEVTGFPQSMFPGLPASKILWLYDHEPEIIKQTKKCIGAKDFINYRLTGEVATDFLEAWWSGLVEFKSYSWSKKMLSSLEIPEEWFPKIHKPQEVIGYVNKLASKKTGLKEGTPVVCGSGDGMCAIIGSGLTEINATMDVTGATEIIASITDKRLPPSIGESIFCWRHLIEGLWIVYASTASSGAALQWFKTQFGKQIKYDAFLKQAEEGELGSNGLIFLPYLIGEYAPFFDLNARGAFIGISLNSKKKHFIRAILEGVAFSLNHILEVFNELDIKIKEVRVGGGGSKSDLWNTIKADVTGRIFLKMKVIDVANLGAAILASIGVKAYSSLSEAIKNMVKISKKIEPNLKKHQSYFKIYEVYKNVYPSLKGIFDKLASI
ncbi:MAG: FGGY family carbohydrate kinase [Candidatus Bathyarchaeia archaeon]